MTHVFDKLLATEYPALDPRVQSALVSPPEHVFEVKSVGDGFALVKDDLPWETAPGAWFPKLGIKSWQESGRLQILQTGQPVRPWIDRVLATPTDAQRLAARAWTETGRPLRLFLAAYVDFSQISEVRFFASREGCRYVSHVTRGSGGESVGPLRREMQAYAVEVASRVPLDSVIVDVALTGAGLRLVDVNPGLTPADIEDLRSAVAAPA